MGDVVSNYVHSPRGPVTCVIFDISLDVSRIVFLPKPDDNRGKNTLIHLFCAPQGAYTI